MSRKKINKKEAVTFPETDIAVEFKNVKYSYPAQEGAPAVDGVSFSVKKGEFLSVIGHNGSGKSTVARLCNGLLECDEGSVFVMGRELDDEDVINAVRAKVGIVFQNPDNQMVASIVEDDIAFGPENLGVPREEIGERITWALEAVGMSEYRTSTPTRLSGGQKQRIAVAGVLAIKPDVIILDESTAMLDPKGRREVISVVKKLNKEEGMTVILITHFMEEALLADRTIVMNKGEIVLQGTPEKVFESSDELKTYNLTLPPISVIQQSLCNFGIKLAPTLDPSALAEEISAALPLNGERQAESKANDNNPSLRNAAEGDNAAISPDSSQTRGGGWDINIRNLCFTYSAKSPFATHALNGVNLTISEGEFFGIIGHTGSGKSTLVQHINALIKLPQAEKKYKAKKVKKGQTLPTMPEITVGKYNLADKKCPFNELRSNVGMVFQYPEYQLFAETVAEDVAFGLKNFSKDMTAEQVSEAVRNAVEVVGLDYEEVKDKSPFDLSGGQKRRVAIAGVIVTRPQILILDEPAAGLDPLGKKEIMELLHKLHREWCKTIIIVSHDMDEIAENCTRAAVISRGEVKFCEKPSQLFRRRDELLSLGLDVPLTAKICGELSARGINVDCDFTIGGFISSIERLFGGEADA